jgi:hypothetical protein
LVNDNIIRDVLSILPQEILKQQEEVKKFIDYYILFIFNMIIIGKSRLQSIIDNVFHGQKYDQFGEIDDIGLVGTNITKGLQDNFVILTTPYELKLFQLLEQLYSTKQLDSVIINMIKNNDESLLYFKDSLRTTSGIELKDTYVNELIAEYIKIITKTQTYKDEQIVSILDVDIENTIKTIHNEIKNPLLTAKDVAEIIYNLFDDDSVSETELSTILQTINAYIDRPFYIRTIWDLRSYDDINELKQDLELEYRVKYSTAKYAVKLNPSIDPLDIIVDRYYYMLLYNPSLINGLLMSPDFVSAQKDYDKKLARRVYNRILERNLYNPETLPINHQLILRYVCHTKKDYLKYIPYYIWMEVENELNYTNEPEMKLYGGKPAHDNKTNENVRSSTRTNVYTFACLLLVLLLVIIIVVVVVVLFVRSKPSSQHIASTE